MPSTMSILAMLFLPCTGLLQSCGSSTPQTRQLNSADSLVKEAKVDNKDTPVDSNNLNHFSLVGYHFYARRQVSHYEFTILEQILYYKIEDGVLVRTDSLHSDEGSEENYLLLLKDITTGKQDTVNLGIDGMGFQEKLRIKVLTTDLEFPNLAFALYWQGASDQIYSKVYGYKGDTLTELFNVPSAGGLVDLERKDKNTLTGHCWGSDELLYWGRDDYVITVSLPNYSVDVRPPDIMDFDMNTEATDTIYAFRRGVSGSKRYVIFPGTPLHIDTFFYKLKTITFDIGDSIFLKADKDAMQGKVKGNTAG